MAAMDEFISRTIAGGQTLVIAGRRGEGKTHFAISLTQNAMSGMYNLDKPVVCITNVVFGQRIAGSSMPIEGYPPGVYHEDTLAGTLRRTGEILQEYGSGNVTIVWMLDEAQNFMLSDMNAAKENLALTKFLGNARKFGLCNMFLTPAINNLTPRIRCFPTGEDKSGYCSVQFAKDKERAERIRPGDGKAITFYKESAAAPWTPLTIKSGSWTRGLYDGKLGVGDYSYDTLSTATFAIGENEHGVPFDLSSFIRATSSGLSHEVPKKISDWFAEWDASGGEDDLPGEDPLTLRIRETCDRMTRIEHIVVVKRAKLDESRRKNGVLQLKFTQEDYAYIEGVSKSTIAGWTRRNETLSAISQSSDKNNDESEPTPPGVYIQPNYARGGGAAEEEREGRSET